MGKSQENEAKIEESRLMMEAIRKVDVESIKGELSPVFWEIAPESIHGEYDMDLPQEVVDFCEAIAKIGGRVLVVGGCVRDAITSHQKGQTTNPKDIDLEVYGIQALDLMALIDMHFGLEIGGTFGKKFEVIKVFGRKKNLGLDITIPRSDNKTGSGSKGFETTSHPEFTIKEAAIRRDLTCNSVSFDPLTGLVYDPFGGVEDINSNVLVATDKEKFIEDPVRVLRIMQFMARFESKVDPETINLCREVIESGEMDDESGERTLGEFSKLFLKGKRPSLGLRFALEVGIIDRYFPEFFKMVLTPQDLEWHPEGCVWEHEMQVIDAAAEIATKLDLNDFDRLSLMFAAWGHDLGKIDHTQALENGRITSHGHEAASRKWMEKVLWPFFTKRMEKTWNRELIEASIALAESHMRPVEIFLLGKEKGINILSQLGRLALKLIESNTSFTILLALSEADQRGRSKTSKFLEESEVVKERREWLKDELSKIKIIGKKAEKVVSGTEIMNRLGLPAGILVGLVEKHVYEHQLAGRVPDVEAGLLHGYNFLFDLSIRANVCFNDLELRGEWPNLLLKKAKKVSDEKARQMKMYYICEQVLRDPEMFEV